MAADSSAGRSGVVKPQSEYFISGGIGPDLIAGKIAGQKKSYQTGAHAIFLGQVRRDEKNGKRVAEIVYSAYEEMAGKEIGRIRTEMVQKYELDGLDIYHSLGSVKAGEISLFILVSSGHREASLTAVKEIVDAVKLEVPIWKKEVFEDTSHRWVE